MYGLVVKFELNFHTFIPEKKKKKQMVKQALDYWKLMQASGGFPVRKARSVDDINYVSTHPALKLLSTP